MDKRRGLFRKFTQEGAGLDSEAALGYDRFRKKACYENFDLL